ncbi:hypothetical protein TR51_00105 [Kitasatospora griseola]|uniref:Uncharacterized protein n=1 Tax=Kitasatospora griseola TaxID=2064 RepID=A0A0D0P3G0_KITGR|nr:hypothetical protein [Kitasatospora griseola]KIQ66151.1 hypothetical protein TR51_00105 [Kitasatospora griseola]
MTQSIERPQNFQTGQWWGIATVHRSGVTSDGKTCMWLEGESGGIKIGAWYYGARPEMAEVGLQAITHGKKVEIGLADHVANSSINVVLLAD